MTRAESLVYEHAVSAHAREPEIIIIRQKLAMFPPVGVEFTLITSSGSFHSRVIARRCLCAGPDSPHEHYYLDLSEISRHIRWGEFSRIRIRRLSDGRYSLSTLE